MNRRQAQTLPPTMMNPRQCGGTGWFYIDPNRILVYPEHSKDHVRITRKQLVAALKVMDNFK